MKGAPTISAKHSLSVSLSAGASGQHGYDDVSLARVCSDCSATGGGCGRYGLKKGFFCELFYFQETVLNSRTLFTLTV